MVRFADTLNSKNYTVKALNEIAKRMGLKGYSKLRKAELAEMIAANIDMPVILDVAKVADQSKIAQIMASVEDAPEEETTVEEIVSAYTLMKATWNRSRGDVQKRIGRRLLAMRTQVKAMGYNPIDLRMGYSIG